MAEEAVLTEEERTVDACVLGTGLTESLVAAALARHGRRVLHLDREEAYGGNWRAMGLRELERWCRAEAPAPPPAADAASGAGEASEATAAPTADKAGSAPAEEAAPAKPVVPEPDRDITQFTAINLEAGLPSSCYRHVSGVWDPFGARGHEEARASREALLKKGGAAFSVDVVPRLLFGRCETVDALVESGVARYLEFQGLKSARVLAATGLVEVPLTKGDIFKDTLLSLPEKRMLMKFITSMSSFCGSLAFQSAAQLGVDQAKKVPGFSEPLPEALEGVDLTGSWASFLQRQKLSARLQDFLTYAICLWDWAPQAGCNELTVGEGLRCLGRFVSSLGMYGRGTAMPLLYPMYGAGEMAQGFTRMCALHRGTYALRTSVTQILTSKDADGSSSIAGVVTHRGEVVRTRSLITSCDHVTQRDASVDAESASICKRMIVIVDKALLSDEGLNLCVVPPASLDPPLENVVQVLQLDWSTGTCPRDHYVLHLSQTASSSASDDSALFRDLDRVLETLVGYVEDGKRSCLFRCTYVHAPRSLVRWDASTSDGALLGTCASAAEGGLVVCADPPAAPQLLTGQELNEALDIFLKTASLQIDPDSSEDVKQVGPDDFLKKPVHVAQEETCTDMADLEAFNEEMLGAARAADLPASLNQASTIEAGEELPVPESETPAPSVSQAAPAAESSDGVRDQSGQ